jgi:hypothetical protein
MYYIYIIAVVQVGAVKIYVAAVEVLRKKERWGQNKDETQFGTKSGAFLNMTSPAPAPLKANILYFQDFL